MTRDEIMNMPEGKEMDELVAEKVMGWHLVKTNSGRDQWHDADGYQHMVSRYDGYEDAEDFETICWHPSESILWAWEVVEKLDYLKLVKSFGLSGVKWIAKIDDVEVFSNTAPLAICRVALLVAEQGEAK
jgi:hypothetical protein